MFKSDEQLNLIPFKGNVPSIALVSCLKKIYLLQIRTQMLLRPGVGAREDNKSDMVMFNLF